MKQLWLLTISILFVACSSKNPEPEFAEPEPIEAVQEEVKESLELDGYYIYGPDVNTIYLCSDRKPYWLKGSAGLAAQMIPEVKAIQTEAYEPVYLKLMGRIESFRPGEEAYLDYFNGYVFIDRVVELRPKVRGDCKAPAPPVAPQTEPLLELAPQSEPTPPADLFQESSPIRSTQMKPQQALQPSAVAEIEQGVFSLMSGSNSDDPSQSSALVQYIYDKRVSTEWSRREYWPLGQEIQGIELWHLAWMEKYGYDLSRFDNLYHKRLSVGSPTLLDGNRIYFSLRNVAGEEWAKINETRPSVFRAIYMAKAEREGWVMEPIPVYYSDEQTFGLGGPRAADPQVWRDDLRLFMTLGSWDPPGQPVVYIVEMDSRTGRIKGYDQATPGYFSLGDPAFHSVATFGEAGFVFKYQSYYYLFLAVNGGNENTDSYRIVVGRSKNVFGPYVDDQNRSFMSFYNSGDYPGKKVLSTYGRYSGPRQPGVFRQSNGRIAFSFQYLDTEDQGVSKFAVREMAFDSQGWPYVVSDRKFDF